MLKYLYIAAVANMYVVVGAFLSMVALRNVARPYDPQRSRAQNALQLVLEVSVLSVGSYLLRQAVMGTAARAFESASFDPASMSETNGGIVLSMAAFTFMKDPIQDKLRHLIA